MQTFVRIAKWATIPLGLASLYGLAYLIGSYGGAQGVTKKDLVDLAVAVGTCASALLALAFALRQEFIKRQESLVVARITVHTILSTLISMNNALVECAKLLRKVASQDVLNLGTISEIVVKLDTLPLVTDQQLIAVTPLQYKCAAKIAQVQGTMVSVRTQLERFRGKSDQIYGAPPAILEMLALVAQALEQGASEVEQALKELKSKAGSEIAPVKIPPSVKNAMDSMNQASADA
ncbi:hypothetical protein [Burkholderia cenocepacia]|uniref:hypothetical protein n=1 Tax=Burkholderia cenocepacia TaxID=95486 RepID=UPI00048566D0|nr:hypothetical protein [Burkholderia cenocepacia]